MFVAIVTAPERPACDDDLGFLLVELGVQDDVGNPALLQELREPLGLLDRDRADEDRLALVAQLDDLVGDGVVLLALRGVDDVLVVLADHRHGWSGSTTTSSL